MSRSFQNLARDPFVNSRPVVRVSIVLWVVGVLLLAGNVWLYWDFLAGREDTYARLAEVESAITETRQRTAELEAELATFDLGEQNQQVEFLNARIERRLFSWSELFDELGEILPNDVQLTRLSPVSGEGEGGGGGASRASRSSTRREDLEEGTVLLRIDAVARNDESILATVDALWRDPSFDQPNLISQTLDQSGLIKFDLETIYEPPRPAEEVTEAPEADGADEPADDDSSPSPDGAPAASTAPSDGPARLGVAASSAPEMR